jgi:O-antigen/teichoic acid export membrane protein
MSSLQCQNPVIEGKAGLHPVVRDVLISGITSIVISAASLLVVSLIGRLGDPQAVAEYLLLRRVSSWILSGALLGIGVALPRYVAHAVNRPALQRTYFSVALSLASAATALIALVIDFNSPAFARLLFGDAAFKTLIVPLSILLIANAFHAAVFGFYRGRLEMERANSLQFLNFAIFPLASVFVLWTRGSVAAMFTVISILVLLSSAIMAIPIFRLGRQRDASLHGISGELLRYGTARIPGDLALGSLFTVAPVIASHYIPLPKLAPLLLGLGILTVLGTSANPLNQVLLSKVTMMLAEGRMAEARAYIQHLVAGSVEISFFVCVQSVIFADVAIRIWVGPKYVNEMLLIRILLVALPFYLLHTALRCVIDAASVTAYNTHNILYTCAVFVAAVAAAIGIAPRAWLLNSIAAAFLLALLVLAWLTIRSLRQLYEVGFAWRNSLPSLALSAALGSVSFFFRWLGHFDTSAFEFVVLQMFLIAAFFTFLNRRSTPWLKFLSDALLQRQTAVRGSGDLVPLESTS